MCSPSEIVLESDFFEMGGDSLKAGRLLSLLRRRFQVRMTIATLFQNSKIWQIRNFIDEAQAASNKLYDDKAEITTALSACTETYSSTYLPLLLLQLAPMVLLYPMKQALRWTSFLYILARINMLWPSQPVIIERYITLLASIFLAKVVLRVCSPFIGIMIKWVIIGRYKEGLYPMWGPYHTRWWFVEKSLKVWGKVSNLHPSVFQKESPRANIPSRVSSATPTTQGPYTTAFLAPKLAKEYLSASILLSENTISLTSATEPS